MAVKCAQLFLALDYIITLKISSIISSKLDFLKVLLIYNPFMKLTSVISQGLSEVLHQLYSVITKFITLVLIDHSIKNRPGLFS